MNDLSNYNRGSYCSCGALGECECACDADWTPKEQYELQNKVEELETKLLCMIEYVERDCACMIPIDRFFNADGSHITKKKYGLVLLEILGQELRDKFLPKPPEGKS